MKEPKNKGKNRSKDTFSATQVGTLLDQFRKDFQVFGENQKSIIKKLDAIYEQVGRNTEDIALLKIAIKNMTAKIETLAERIDKNTAAIEHLAQSIDSLVKTKADHEEMQDLKRRLVAVESKVAALSK